MTYNRTILLSLGLGIVAVLLGVCVWLFRASLFAFLYAPANSAVTALPSAPVATSTTYDASRIYVHQLSSDSDLIKSDELNKQQKYVEAAALLDADMIQPGRSISEIGMLKYRAAEMYAYAGQYAKAVSYYKQIGENTAYTPEVRANALQNMAHLYAIYQNPEITKAIFTGPYADLLQGTAVPASYRNLYIYITGIYPLALSELYVADWFAANLEGSTTLSVQDKARYARTVHNRLLFAQPDFDTLKAEYVSADNNEIRYQYLNTLEEKAVVVGYMEVAGDVSFGKAEPLFQELMAGYAAHISMTSDWTARFQYAAYLARRDGAKSSSRIIELLAPICRSPEAHGHGLIPYMKSVSKTSSQVLLLASLDPEFKELLIANGWSSSVFK